MGGKQRDTLRSYNVIMVIARRIVLVCKAVVQRPIIDQHSIPDFSNELGKQSFQNEFLNKVHRGRGEGGEEKKTKKKKTGAGGFWSSTPRL